MIFGVHCAVESYFHYACLIDYHFYNKIIIPLYTFFTNPYVQRKHTFAALVGVQKKNTMESQLLLPPIKIVYNKKIGCERSLKNNTSEGEGIEKGYNG